MKRIIFTVGAALLLTTPLLAENSVTENSLHFSTAPGAEYAWELAWNGSQWELSFVDDAIIVDDTNPEDTQLDNDFVLLPTMNISGVDDRTSLVMATLDPQEAFRIQSDTDNALVLTATMHSGGMLAVGTNTVAYSNQDDDLDIGSHNETYGTVIPALVADERRGLMLDLSFSGDAIQGANLYNLLTSADRNAVARGTLSGQITAIPEPATLLILGLGAAVANQFRSRRRRQ
jgi:hypothetical protein